MVLCFHRTTHQLRISKLLVHKCRLERW